MGYYRRKCPREARTLADELRRAARALRNDLRANRLTVELVPSRRPEIAARGGMIRIVVEQNPEWYRRFCTTASASRSRPRRTHDTSIKRANTLMALEEMIQGCARSPYAQRLLPLVRKQADADRVPF